MSLPAATLVCFYGPKDGDTVEVAEGQWRVELPAGVYRRCSGLSDARGENMSGDCLLWFAAPTAEGETT